MYISKTVINSLLIVIACTTLSAVTTIVHAKQNSDRVLSESGIKYELPYPGILPDNLFYKIKMARDKMWEFLISDLEKKAYFEILMADKRVAAARVLIEEKDNQKDLGISTFTKGYKYLEKAPAIIKALREKNYNTNNLIDKLEKAATKHAFYVDKFLKRRDLSESQKNELKTLGREYKGLLSKIASLR